jgi:hypothetical protein
MEKRVADGAAGFAGFAGFEGVLWGAFFERGAVFRAALVEGLLGTEGGGGCSKDGTREDSS